MPVLPAGTLRARVITQTPSRVCHNEYFYQPEGAGPTDQPGIQKIANAIDSHFRTVWCACMLDSCLFKGVMVYWHGGDDVLLEAFSVGGPSEGTDGADTGVGNSTLPDEVVMTIRKLTGHAGREDRGRSFISGLPETWNANGRLHQDNYAEANALAAKIPMDIVIEPEGDDYADTLHARHWNRKDNTMRPIIGALVNSVLESRRDRRRPLESVPISGSEA